MAQRQYDIYGDVTLPWLCVYPCHTLYACRKPNLLCDRGSTVMKFYQQQYPEEGYQYYHNVLVTCVGISTEWWEQFYPDIDEIWDIQHITSSRPRVTWVYVDEDLDDQDYDWELSNLPHAVVAIGADGSIACYDTDNYDDEEMNPWEF